MKQISLLLMLLAVGIFMIGCSETPTTPDPGATPEVLDVEEETVEFGDEAAEAVEETVEIEEEAAELVAEPVEGDLDVTEQPAPATDAGGGAEQ